jgi:choline dehydrogenase
VTNEFDYVIVGGGTAAGILAWRLGEAGHSVCVLEAGPRDRSMYIRVPAGFSRTLLDPSITWQLKSEPDPEINGRSVAYTQGKTLGGSSSVNGMIYNRGQDRDFDAWASAGNAGWSYPEVLPYFQKTERRLGTPADPSYRGMDGRLPVITAKWPNELERAFIESATRCGHPFNPDYNGASQLGVGPYQSTIFRGRRVSTATAFLRPAAARFRVDVRTDSLVTRVLLDGRRAIGVTYRCDGGELEVRARYEVVLAAGTVNSPKILQLSGIGPGALLNEHSLAVRHDLCGVGENFRDHYSPRIVARARGGVDSVNLHVRGLPLMWQVLRWIAGRTSILSLSPGRVHLFGKSDPSLERPDFCLVFMPASFKAGLVGILDDVPGMTCGAWQMRPASSGYVRIVSPDPLVPPRLNPRYLSESGDKQVLIAALREARRIFGTAPLASLIEADLLPDANCVTSDDWLAFARNFGSTSFHLVGSCKMGPDRDPLAVVDARLRVRGMEALRVIDASVMPTIPSANTYAATMMIAEKGADMLIKDASRAH